MITYELAKELKDAGFPKEINLGTFIDNKDGTLTFADFPEYPTLSELIEACGEDFWALQKYDIQFPTKSHKTWLAFTIDSYKFGQIHLNQDGNNPEEAIARLWLLINKYNKR